MLTDPVFVFPGQGSQHPGMLRDLSVCAPAARRLVAEAERVTGVPVGDLMATADAATIADPRLAQLLVFVSSSVMLAELRDRGLAPAVVAGHSLGEYTALVAAGCLEWRAALEIVAYHGQAMADAARRRPGAMGAIVGLPLAAVERLCVEAVRHGVVVPANVNSARQVVVSGTAAAVEIVLAAAGAAGAMRARRIPVGGAYHSPLMDDARERLAEVLRAAPLAAPRVPFVSSVTAEFVTDVEAYRETLIQQVTRPVRWHDTVRRLAGPTPASPAAEGRVFVEVGPGKVLTGLGRETLRPARHLVFLEALRELARTPVAAATVPGELS